MSRNYKASGRRRGTWAQLITPLKTKRPVSLHHSYTTSSHLFLSDAAFRCYWKFGDIVIAMQMTMQSSKWMYDWWPNAPPIYWPLTSCTLYIRKQINQCTQVLLYILNYCWQYSGLYLQGAYLINFYSVTLLRIG